MKAMYRLIFINFIKSWYNIFFVLILPFCLAIIACLSWTMMDLIRPVHMIPACTYISIVCVGIVAVPLTIFNFKQSGLVQRITSSKYSAYDFLFCVISFFAGICLISYIFNFTIATLVVYGLSHASERSDISHMIHYADYVGVMYSFFLTTFMSILIGVAIGMWSKSPLFIQVLSTFVILFTTLMGFWIAPIALLEHEIGGSIALKISYSCPYRYITCLFTESWLNYSNEQAIIHGGIGFNLFGKTIFNLSTPYSTNVLTQVNGSVIFVNLLSTADKNLDILIPNAIIIVSIGFIFFKYIKENRMVFRKIDNGFIKKYNEGVKHV